MNNKTFLSVLLIFIASIVFFVLFTFNIVDRAYLIYLYPFALGLFAIIKVVDAIMTPLVIYNFIIGLSGLFLSDKKSEYNTFSEYKSFALIICAHNEDTILKNTLYEMEKIKYPIDKLTFIVVCDNCSDNTIPIAKQVKVKYQKPLAGSLVPRRGYKFNMHVLERFNTTQKGKPYAVKYALDYIKNNNITYDAISIADADNIYHPDFFLEMNKKLLEGKHIIQGYLGVKNPYDSFITSSSMLSYSASSRFFFTARENLGMSSALGGTGFVLSKHALETIPWTMKSLVEDLEYSIKAVIHGYTVHYAYHAKTFDEKPLELSVSINQRKRWMQGHWYVCFTNIIPLIQKIFTFKWKQLPTQIDYLLYLISPGRVILQGWLLISFLLLFPFSLLYPDYRGYFALDSLFKILLLILPILQSYYFAVIEGFKKEKIVDIVYYYFVFSLSYVPLTLKALWHWREQSTWVKTVHTQKATISDFTS